MHVQVRTRSVAEIVQFYYLWKRTDQYAAYNFKMSGERRRFSYSTQYVLTTRYVMVTRIFLISIISRQQAVNNFLFMQTYLHMYCCNVINNYQNIDIIYFVIESVFCQCDYLIVYCHCLTQLRMLLIFLHPPTRLCDRCLLVILSVCGHDCCRSNLLISLKLSVFIGPINGKN